MTGTENSSSTPVSLCSGYYNSATKPHIIKTTLSCIHLKDGKIEYESPEASQNHDMRDEKVE